MNWIKLKSLKEKSFSVVQDYKNEFKSFVLSLKEEINGGSIPIAICFIYKLLDKNINDDEKNSTELETFKNKSKNTECLRNILRKFIDIDKIK